MKLLAALSILSFLGIAVFGFLAMGFDGVDGHANCLAATVNGNLCPKANGVFDFSHLSVFRSFSTATLQTILASAFLIGIVFLSARGLKILNFRRHSLDFPIFNFTREEIQLFSKARRSFIRWLAFHENSPAVF